MGVRRAQARLFGRAIQPFAKKSRLIKHTLRKSDALEALNELGSKATIAAATEAAKAGMKASLRFLAEAAIGAAQTGI